MFNKKEYYENTYKPGEWRNGIKSSTLQVQIRDIEKRKKMGAYQEPYETTAVALLELLDKADASNVAAMQEMKAMYNSLTEGHDKINELSTSLKAAQDEIAALKAAKNETVQPKVATNSAKGTPVNSSTPAGGGKPKTK